MTEKEYFSATRDVIYLASCAVNGSVPDRERVAGMNLDALYAVAHHHQLTAITAMSLEAAGIKFPLFTQAKGKAIRKNAALNLDRAALTERLEAEGIWYMPLKGAVLADYYPEFGMRQMSDNDILIDPCSARRVKEIMQSIGFKVEHFGKELHDEYSRPPVSYFEIHRCLFTQRDKNMYDYYKDIASRLKKEEGTYARHFSDEDFYIYLTAHEYRHFSGSGTGLRSLLDIYVYLQKFGKQLDGNYIEQEIKKLGLEDFEKRNRELALRLFSGEAISEQEEDWLRYFILSGVHGTAQNKLEKQGRWHYFWTNLFPSYRVMATRYPVLRKAPFLMPVCWLYRFIGKLIIRPERIKRKLRNIWNFRKH